MQSQFFQRWPWARPLLDAHKLLNQCWEAPPSLKYQAPYIARLSNLLSLIALWIHLLFLMVSKDLYSSLYFRYLVFPPFLPQNNNKNVVVFLFLVFSLQLLAVKKCSTLMQANFTKPMLFSRSFLKASIFMISPMIAERRHWCKSYFKVTLNKNNVFHFNLILQFNNKYMLIT